MKKIREPTRGTKQKQQTCTDFLKLGLESWRTFTHKCNMCSLNPGVKMRFGCQAHLIAHLVFFPMLANVFTTPTALS